MGTKGYQHFEGERMSRNGSVSPPVIQVGVGSRITKLDKIWYKTLERITSSVSHAATFQFPFQFSVLELFRHRRYSIDFHVSSVVEWPSPGTL